MSSDAEICATDLEVFDRLAVHVRSTSLHFSPASDASPSTIKQEVLCWWHRREACTAAHGFSRFVICDFVVVVLFSILCHFTGA
jgi:hypothetical protein